MKSLQFLLIIGLATASPTPQELAQALGAENAVERKRLTLEIWNRGSESLAALKELIDGDDPEVAMRAGFIYRRLRLGLKSDSPEELLILAEKASKAPAYLQKLKLSDLLEHPEGFPPAVALLDLWSEDAKADTDHLAVLASEVTSALSEQPHQQEHLAKINLSLKCKGLLIADLSFGEFPRRDELVTILAIKQPTEVYQAAIHFSPDGKLPPHSHLALARAALVKSGPKEALHILAQGIDEYSEFEILRAFIFLERITGLRDQIAVKHQLDKLKILRALVDENHDEVGRLLEKCKLHDSFTLQSAFLAKQPIDIDHSSLSHPQLFKAIQLRYGDQASPPDLEAISSLAGDDGSLLARGLICLGAGEEAAQVLRDHHKNHPALGVLWHMGFQKEAIAFVESTINDADEKESLKLRLGLVRLLISSGKLDAARKWFDPLFQEEIPYDYYRRIAVRTALKLYPLERVTDLTPEIHRENRYQLELALGALLPSEGGVAMLALEMLPDEDLGKALPKVTEVLRTPEESQREFIRLCLKEIKDGDLKTKHPTIQAALMMKLEEVFPYLEKIAWRTLSPNALLSLIRDETWPLELRKKALTTALEVAPTNSILRAYDFKMNEKGSLDLALQLSLAEPEAALALTPFYENSTALEWACRLADLKVSSSYKCLKLLANAEAKQGHWQKAERRFHSFIWGDLAFIDASPAPVEDLLWAIEGYLLCRSKTQPEKAEQWLAFHKALRSGN